MFLNRYCIVLTLVLIGLLMPLTVFAQPVYGPVTLERTLAKPSKLSATFLNCNPAAEYQLVIDTTVGANKRVASATVSLNGMKVVQPSEFKQRVEQIKKTVELAVKNQLDIDLAGIPGSALTLSIECVSGCLNLELDHPLEGVMIEAMQVLARGRIFNGSGEVGVTLRYETEDNPQRQPALIDANSFYAPVILNEGDNRLTATATDTCGYQVERTVTVRAEAPAVALTLSAWPPSGLVEYDSGKLSVDLSGAVTTTEQIARYDWDIDGDGSVDQTGTELAEMSVDYDTPGLYQPTLIVTTASGKTVSATTVVQVLNPEQVDVLIQPKWEAMKQDLVAGDIAAALSRFAESSRSKYSKSFERLGDKRADIFSDMKELRLVYVKDRIAKYDIKRDIVINGETRSISFPVYLSKDNDGIWKIDQF